MDVEMAKAIGGKLTDLCDCQGEKLA